MPHTITIPCYALSNQQLLAIGKTLTQVESELVKENGPDPQAQDCVHAIADELQRRGRTVRLDKNGKFIW